MRNLNSERTREEVVKEIKNYLGLAKEQLEIAEKLQINYSNYITLALNHIRESFNILHPFLTFEGYLPFATHLSNLAKHLDSVNLEKESKLAQEIHTSFTRKVLSNILQ